MFLKNAILPVSVATSEIRTLYQDTSDPSGKTMLITFKDGSAMSVQYPSSTLMKQNVKFIGTHHI